MLLDTSFANNRVRMKQPTCGVLKLSLVPHGPLVGVQGTNGIRNQFRTFQITTASPFFVTLFYASDLISL